jgi:hypothetical protein
MSLKTTEFVTNSNMVIVPHPPYSPDLAPCDFALFPKLNMKLKGRRFETVSESKGNRKRDSIALRKMTSTVILKRGKNYEIAVYFPKKIILKEMAAKIKLCQHSFFFYPVRELSDTTSYM